MHSGIQNDDDDAVEGFSWDEDSDDGLDEDMEALRRACTLAGSNLNDFRDTYSGGNNSSSSTAEVKEEKEEANGDSSGGEEADLELFRSIKNRFSIGNDSLEPLFLKLPFAISPDLDNEDDDFDTLCAVQRRFAAYDTSDVGRRMEKNLFEKSEGVLETLNELSTGRRTCKVFPDTEDDANTLELPNDNMEIQSCSSDRLNALQLSSLGIKHSSSFPQSAQLFIDAIKRNRFCQKFLQSKLTQIEARIEENKKLKERVKILRDFQVSCRRITGRALGQGKDPRIQLISAGKTSKSRDTKVNDKKVSAMCNGPVENSQVANYRMALSNFPILLKQKKWTEAEKENLRKGIRQQFQEMVLQFSVDQFSGSEGSPADANNLDAILASIRDLEISPERCREFLPKVNWDQLASLYVVGHTGAECEAQWLNFEDPLINHGAWTVEEDKRLLFIVQEKGMTNWFDIAVLLGNRTPFQCLARFQRSLNARIIKREWTKEEDAQLCIAVETYGENDWQSVASTLEGRTGPQCSNRWKKTLHPSIYRVGRWNLDESLRLKVAVMLFGPKNWKKIAQFVPGRTPVKCRERWFNCVDPSLNMDKWTAEEDLRLKAAIEEYGYCWAKVAKCLQPRTDSQCRRRWKVLFPHEVPLLQAARRMQKAATISNFVDRESERPALGPHDFVPPPSIRSASEPEKMNQSRKHKRKTREGKVSGKDKNAAPGNTSKRLRFKRQKGGMQISSLEDLGKTNAAEDEISGANDAVVTKRRKKSWSGKSSHTELNQDDLFTNSVLPLVTDDKVVTRKKKKFTHPKRNKLIQKEVDGNSQIQPMLDPGAIELAHGHLHSNILARNNSEQDDTVRLLDASCQITELPIKGKIHMEIAADSVEGLMLPTESSEFRVTNTKNVNSSFDSISSSKVNKVSMCKRKRSTEPLGKGRDVELVHSQCDGQKMSEVRSKTGSKQILDPNDEGDVMLASFLRNKSVKRNQVLNIADQTCFPSNMKKGSELVLKRFDQHDEGNKMPPLARDRETEAYDNNEIAENVLPSEMHPNNSGNALATGVNSKELCVEILVNKLVHSQRDGQKMSEVRSKSGSNQILDPNDEGDVTLASFLQNKSVKRNQVLNIADQTYFPSNMKGSELVPKRFDQHDEGNKMPPAVRDHETEACDNNEIAENVSKNSQATGVNSKELCVENMVNCRTDDSRGPIRELMSINDEVDLEGADITLASLLRKKRGKKGQVPVKGGG